MYEVLCDIAKNNKNVKIINLSKNFGQHNALICGYRFTSGDIIISLDDDGQTDPKQCYKLIDKIDNKIDVVFAKYSKKKHNHFRNFGSFMTKLMSYWLCEIPLNIYISSYFVCKRYVIDEICNYNNPYTFLGGLIYRVTKNVDNAEIEHYNRDAGKSGYTLKKLINLWLNGLTAFSVKPLRLSAFVGSILALVGFFYGVYIIISKFLNPNRVLGYSSIMCAILFVGGMILFMLGLIGEYIGRIYICINHSPQYVIKEKINFDD